jgi:hypothetical protein
LDVDDHRLVTTGPDTGDYCVSDLLCAMTVRYATAPMAAFWSSRRSKSAQVSRTAEPDRDVSRTRHPLDTD